MTGKFFISRSKEMRSSHERMQLQLSDGRVIHYEDQRKFGKWNLLDSPESVFNKLGLEPNSKEFTLSAFKSILKVSRSIKTFLMDQRFVAGIGNIYADEALWEAKIHPLRKTNSLSATEIKNLHQAIIKVIALGIKNTGTTLGSSNANYYSVSGRRGKNQNELKVFRKEKTPCPRCGSEIIKIVVAQRGTHLCPNCQAIKL